MELAYFLGCIMNNRYPGIEKATKILFENLDVELKDMDGASCCPAPGVLGSFDKTSWAAVAARNITIAEDMGDNIMTECNGCFGSLYETNNYLKEDEDAKENINKILAEVGREYKGEIDVKHFAQILHDEIGVDKIAKLVTQPLNLNVAVHYGCHFLKPSDEMNIDNPENPTILEDIIEATGAKPIEYKDKMMCCGAGGGVRSRDLDVSLDFANEKLNNMKEAGADVIINVCPFCHLQFDVGQKQVEEKYGNKYDLPVFHLAQLLGLAMGLTPEDLTFEVHSIDTSAAVEKALNN